MSPRLVLRGLFFTAGACMHALKLRWYSKSVLSFTLCQFVCNLHNLAGGAASCRTRGSGYASGSDRMTSTPPGSLPMPDVRTTVRLALMKAGRRVTPHQLANLRSVLSYLELGRWLNEINAAP
jgi:hypothetical protein